MLCAVEDVSPASIHITVIFVAVRANAEVVTSSLVAKFQASGQPLRLIGRVEPRGKLCRLRIRIKRES